MVRYVGGRMMSYGGRTIWREDEAEEGDKEEAIKTAINSCSTRFLLNRLVLKRKCGQLESKWDCLAWTYVMKHFREMGG